MKKISLIVFLQLLLLFLISRDSVFAQINNPKIDSQAAERKQFLKWDRAECNCEILFTQISQDIIHNPLYKKLRQDSNGIKITEPNFKELILKLTVQALDSNFRRDTTFYINFIRTVNTIQVRLWGGQYSCFIRLFADKIIDDAIEILNAGYWKGGAYFSQKYNLYIGGELNSNSQYSFF